MSYKKEKFFGDQTQALGIKQALEVILAESKIAVVTTGPDVVSLKQSILSAEALPVIVVGAGSNGLADLQALKTDPDIMDKVFAVWSGHMVFPGLTEAVDQLDVIALPTHVLSEGMVASLRDGSAYLVQTVGVAHDLTPAKLEAERSIWEAKNTPLPVAEKYIGVFLGGDAPDMDGVTQKFFTPEEAAILAEYVADRALETGATVLLTNGARTGKFNPATGERRKNIHRDGTVDPTTQTFLDKLKERDVAVYFYDFQFNRLPSAYTSILDVLRSVPGSVTFVTGESTSMVSEIGDILPRGAMVIAEIGSMNDAHKAHVNSCYRAGIASGIKAEDGKVAVVEVEIQKGESLSAAQVIARHAAEKFQQRVG